MKNTHIRKYLLHLLIVLQFILFSSNCNILTGSSNDSSKSLTNLIALYLLTSSSDSVNCTYIKTSVTASTTGTATVTCDTSYAYIASDAYPTHTMMSGITGTNLQVPTAQAFSGTTAWKFPLSPAVATTSTTPTTGPIGMAINGVLLYNPCKQEGCSSTSGDTKALGELDTCNGHAGRSDDYHYHAAPTCMMSGQSTSYWDTHPVGWLLDGFALYGYNDASGSIATRDSECGGNTNTVYNGPSGYSYHLTDTFPYILACLRGTPSSDFAGQAAHFTNMRNDPVTPFTVSSMTLTTDSSGYSVLQFTSANTFNTRVNNGTFSILNTAGVNQIKYKQLTGTDLSTALASAAPDKTKCWQFLFPNAASSTTMNFCK
jgi:hypothetical protein